MVKETKNNKKAEMPKKEVGKAKTEKPKVEKTEEKPEKKPTTEKAAEKIEVKEKSIGQAIVIAVLATILGCAIIVFTVLFATGVIKFDNGENSESSVATEDDKDKKGEESTDDNDKKDDHSDTGKTSTSNIIDNPYKQVTESGTFVKVGVLEFYLPRKFEYGGKNKDGAFTYNLANDDGWAQVLVFAEKSSLTPAKFLTSRVSSYLDITDSAYKMNGTTWVQAENAYALAYATELDGKIYAVYYSVKLDSDATGKAMQMIPKTLYMKKIYKN